MQPVSASLFRHAQAHHGAPWFRRSDLRRRGSGGCRVTVNQPFTETSQWLFNGMIQKEGQSSAKARIISTPRR